ncbi:CUE domain-containing protein 1b isoform X3 [Channa argus]|uniref:CUE domain-containing protein 1b isoform X3 n=1 Tax=Channa argus TaxID=215402 RepID=UPI00352274AA
MTSLFRRRSSNGGSRSSEGGGGVNNGQAQLNNNRPSRQVRRLEFNKAMEDFKTMFPSMDYEVIECVLRSNNGAVDATIDQLLQMNIEGQGSDDSSDSDDSIPPEILERTLEPDSSDEEAPPVYSPPTYDTHIYNRKNPETPSLPTRFENQPLPDHQQVRSYRNWNPPLLGNLPDDFLRILPQQLNSTKMHQNTLSLPSSVSSIRQWRVQPHSWSGTAQTPQGSGLATEATEQEKKLKQYLEDERIALFLQNEEFMKELQRNHEFLIALERATRKKLFEIARTFSERTKRGKSRRRTFLKHHLLGTANSTANLLEDIDGNICDFSPLQYLQVLSPPFFTCHKEKKGLFPALE